MKKLRSFIIMSMILCCLTVLAACSKDALNVPTGLDIDDATYVLTWDEVPYSTGGYKVDISGMQHETKENWFSLAFLPRGEYEIKVQAITIDKYYFVNSGWSVTIPFERPRESGLKYKLINYDTEYELSEIGRASGAVVMESVYLGKPVTSIGAQALVNVTGITSLTIGSNVTKIGASAFQSCANLTSVIIPEGVITIGDYAFQNCTSLTSVVIPDSVITMGQNAFAYCTSLKSVEIGENVTGIGRSAFAGCGALEEVIIGESVKSIGDSAFRACISLESITIPDSVTTIETNAFYACSALIDAEIGSGVKTIGEYAFSNTALWEQAPSTPGIVYAGSDNKWVVGCKNEEIVSASLVDDTVGIADGSFKNLSKLDTVAIPNSVRFIGMAAFYKCIALYNKKTTSSIGLVLGSGIESIGLQAFNETGLWNEHDEAAKSVVYAGINTNRWVVDCRNKAISDAFIDNGTVGIADAVFSGCTYLGAVALPSGFKYIGDHAFEGAESLTRVVLALTDITFPNGLIKIGASAFRDCVGLSSITIPASVTSIGDAAFYGCLRLTTVNIAANIERIGNYVFYGCQSLTAITMPASVKSIGDYAFYSCYSLPSITLGSNVESIGAQAFFNCIALTTITIPDSVITLGNYAFSGCEELESVIIGDGLTAMGNYVFAGCIALESVTLGDSVKSISDYAFQNCVSLIGIAIPDSVKSIGNYAFYGCGALESIVIPVTVLKMGGHVFFECPKLKVYCEVAKRPSVWSIHWNSTIRLPADELNNRPAVNSIAREVEWGYNSLLRDGE